MFGLSIGEIVVILVVALLVLGPSKLPSVAKQLGKGLREFRRAASDLQRAFNDAAELDERPRPPGAKPGVPPTPSTAPPAPPQPSTPSPTPMDAAHVPPDKEPPAGSSGTPS